MTDMTVANEILRQLGGKRFLTMTGANGLVASDNSLSFRVPSAKNGIKAVRIELASNDTYKMTFLKIRKFVITIVSETEGLYFDMLQTEFTNQTGLYTSLN